ncbi:glycosyl hydrolase family 43 [Opitutaceae bacterium TAV1]|nr:glycosyl hydrolase family 43 [Opitutaceae bacterium TAV1]
MSTVSSAVSATAFAFAPISPDNGFRQPDYWTWCPSIIRAPDTKAGGRMRWHMFASRWPKWLPFHPGWMVASEVVRAVAERAEGPYEFAGVVLPARGAEYWDGRSTHNPTIRYHGGRYWLFYMGSTHPFADFAPENAGELDTDHPACIVARSMKRVGVAWAESVRGPWHRLDGPVLPTKPGTFYSFLTSNPAPWIHNDGRVTMLFKARAWRGHVRGPMSIGLAEADEPGGPYRVVNDSSGPLFSPEPPVRFGEVEDPFLWQEGGEGGVFRMIAKDMTGRLCGQAHAGILAESRPGAGGKPLDWRPGTPPLAYRRELGYTDGTRRTVGSMERPFVHFENGRPSYFCAAVSNGKNGFSDATETWNVVLPLVSGETLGLASGEGEPMPCP